MSDMLQLVNKIGNSQCATIQVAAEKGAVKQVLSDAEERRLFKALQKADRRHTIRVFIAALETGARRSSLVEFLKWKHVNFKAEEVTITTYKDRNMKQWEISVSTRLKAELLKLKLQRKSDDLDEVVRKRERKPA